MDMEERPNIGRRIVGLVSRALDIVQIVFIGLVVALVAASALLLFWQVVSRSLFDGGSNWIPEFARLALVWMTFLGAAVLMREARHLAVDYFVQKLPEKLQLATAQATSILLIALMAVLLAYSGTAWASSSVLITPSLGIPRSALVAAAIISYSVTLIYLVESIVRTALGMGPANQLANDEDVFEDDDDAESAESTEARSVPEHRTTSPHTAP